MTAADFLSLADYGRHFAATAPAGVRAWVDGGAGDGITAAENLAAFAALRLWPRVLGDLRAGSAATELFGRPLAAPVLIAPTACHALLDPEGELATATAAALTGTPMIVSTQASVRIEDLTAAVPGADLWFQIYPQPVFADTLDLCRRAVAAGCRALVLTVDAPVSGVRNAEQRAGFVLPEAAQANLRDYAPPPVVEGPRSPVFRGLVDPALRWAEAGRICAESPVPVLFKGILHPDDALKARAAGAAGVVVSNHGGRVLDTVPPAIAALPAIRRALGPGVPVLVDGGVRRGTDVVKALALGADAVLLGRPVLHALFAAGMSGVAHALTLLQTETEAAMALLGAARPGDIDATLIWSGPQ
ncbi:alpha-hydroxy acid oxidase [Paenirhodobacter enshiensis]|uniref:alpha-hydroxy acid oxidase n=1 Tax=Paenirhodobacter enshiensis TaxID=1105367 RepID=UPI0035B21DCD